MDVINIIAIAYYALAVTLAAAALFTSGKPRRTATKVFFVSIWAAMAVLLLAVIGMRTGFAAGPWHEVLAVGSRKAVRILVLSIETMFTAGLVDVVRSDFKHNLMDDVKWVSLLSLSALLCISIWT